MFPKVVITRCNTIGTQSVELRREVYEVCKYTCLIVTKSGPVAKTRGLFLTLPFLSKKMSRVSPSREILSVAGLDDIGLF